MSATESINPTSEQLQLLETDQRLQQAAEMITGWDSYYRDRTASVPEGESASDVHAVVSDFLKNPDIDVAQRGLFGDLVASLETTMQYDELGEYMDVGRRAMLQIRNSVSDLDLPRLGYYTDFTVLEIERYKNIAGEAIKTNYQAESDSRSTISRADSAARDVAYDLVEIDRANSEYQRELDPYADASKIDQTVEKLVRTSRSAITKLGSMNKDQIMNFLVAFADREKRFDGLTESVFKVLSQAKESYGFSDVASAAHAAKGWASGVEQLYYDAGLTPETLNASRASLINAADSKRDQFRTTRNSSADNFDSVSRSFQSVREQILTESQYLLQHTTRKS